MEGQLLSSILGLMRPMITAYLPMSDGTQCHIEIAHRLIKLMLRIEHIEAYFKNGWATYMYSAYRFLIQNSFGR